MNIVEKPTRQSQGDHSTIFMEPEANNCFSINGYVVLNSVVNICFDVEIIVLHLFDYLYQA